MTTAILPPPPTGLRQRMIEDMEMRRFSRETQRNYLRDVGRFARFLGRSPDTATADDIRQFQIAQHDAGTPVPTMNSIVSALRFLFTITVDRPDLARRLVRAKHPRNLPIVLSQDEVARLLDATTSLKHRAALSVAISNRRLIAMDEAGVTFRYKDYRRDGAERYQTMTLVPAEFIRRFLLHVLPRGFHRIRHHGLLASAVRKDNINHIRELLGVPQPVVQETSTGETTPEPWCRCPCCGGPMVTIGILARSIQPRAPPPTPGSAGRWVS